MKVILSEQDVKQAVILYLKSQGLISPKFEYVADIQSYSSDFMIIKEFKPEVQEEEKK